jgi:hypothetical protein
VKIYLAAAMTDAARDLEAIGTVLRCLEDGGHDVPTRHVADPRGREADGHLSDAELARRDLEWVAGCNALVAEVSTPSHGVGIEVAAALAGHKPVLLVHRRGAAVSRLLLGLPGVDVAAYGDHRELPEAIRHFLARVQRACPADETDA